MGVSNMGDPNIQVGIQTYRGYPNIWGDPNIQGPSKDMGVPKQTGGIQTYGGCLSIYLKSDHYQILSRKVEMRFCSSSGQNIGQYIRHPTASCSYQHTVQNSKEYFEKKWIKYAKLKKKSKMADVVQDYKKMFGCPLYIQNTKKACFVRLRGVHMLPYIWMLPVCKQQNESMFCPNKGASICPHTFGFPLYV